MLTRTRETSPVGCLLVRMESFWILEQAGINTTKDQQKWTSQCREQYFSTALQKRSDKPSEKELNSFSEKVMYHNIVNII